MRRSLGVSLGLMVAAHTRYASADPSTPQVSPIHLQREDAQRVREQQRDLDRDAPAPVVADPGKPAPATQVVDPDRDRRIAGEVLLGIAGVSALAAIPVLAPDSSSGSADSSSDTLGILLISTAVATGLGGIALIGSSRSAVQVAPAITARSVGLAVMGRL